MLLYLAFMMRVLDETGEPYRQTLILSALHTLQGCPTSGISLQSNITKTTVECFLTLGRSLKGRSLLGYIMGLCHCKGLTF